VDPDRDDAARLRRGDSAGLAGLMERHQESLFRCLLRLLGDETVAEDVFQQTWLQVAERISRYDASRPFAPWLVAVGRNLALDHLRRRQPESLDEGEEPVATGLPADPLALAALRQRGERLSAAVASLAPLDREVLALRFEADLALPELAQTLAVPVPTAKARLYRALARLRARLVTLAPAGEWR
jgi:RNA polymerase sigma-70 factor (ECF subfamily)